MKTTYDPSTVVVCVTAQRDCEKMIKIACEIAKNMNATLEVLNISPSTELSGEVCGNLDYLYTTAKKYGAQMTIHFNSDPIIAAAAHIARVRACRLVAGVPGDNTSDFIHAMHMLLPSVPITVYSRKENICFEIATESAVRAPVMA